MNKHAQQAAADASVGVDLHVRYTDALADRIGGFFARPETRAHAPKYIRALMSEIPKRNGWTLAEHIGDSSPDKCQRLLSSAVWDQEAVLDEIAVFAVEELNRARSDRRRGLRVGVLDETGQQKKGSVTAGVKRQHMGCAGRVENGINTVHLSFVREGAGHAIIAHRQWVPEAQIDDAGVAAVMGLPEDLEFATKGEIAAELCRRMRELCIDVDFVAGDEVYGSSPDLRAELEEQCQAYVLRVRSNHRVTLATGERITLAHAVKKKLRAKKFWDTMSAGKGSKGNRWYEWAWLATESDTHVVLIRRHLKTGELAFHYCHVPEGQPLTKARLIRGAGLRWPVEECFEFGKDYFGLDQSQVRLYIAIRRYTILVTAALAICAATAAALRERTDSRARPPTSIDDLPPSDPGMIPLTIKEIQRIVSVTPDHGQAHSDRWCAWRRRHQARSAWYHQRAHLDDGA